MLSPSPKYDYDQDSILDDIDMSLDISSLRVLEPGVDVMADFGGYLQTRQKERNIPRNTMMSQIDGLVSNLNTDVDKIMDS